MNNTINKNHRMILSIIRDHNNETCKENNNLNVRDIIKDPRDNL